jgi:hypothetical protein
MNKPNGRSIGKQIQKGYQVNKEISANVDEDNYEN